MHFSKEPAGPPSKEDRGREHRLYLFFILFILFKQNFILFRIYFIKQNKEALGEMVYVFLLPIQRLSYYQLSSQTDH